ncbi:hypothetical protein LDENG_00072900, partial [Lucifuga dentata]
TEVLIHALVTSQIDYCNAVSSISNKLLASLQIIQNSAARIVTCTQYTDHITPILQLYSPSLSLRSSLAGLLSVPSTQLRTMGGRAFSCNVLRLWNSLPQHTRQLDCSHLQITHQNQPV